MRRKELTEDVAFMEAYGSTPGSEVTLKQLTRVKILS